MRGGLSVSLALALVLLLGVVILVAVVPLLPGYDPFSQNLASSLLTPGEASIEGQLYLLGSDALGRDVLSRLALAGRISLFIGFSAVVLSLAIGVVLGLIAGFFRGWIENLIMGIADLQLSIPRVLLLIAIAAIVGTGVLNLAILLGLTSWVVYGRVARAMALSLREREFVLSATTQGRHLGLEHSKASVAQRAAADADRRLVRTRPDHRAGGIAELPRPWRAAADAELGSDGQ